MALSMPTVFKVSEFSQNYAPWFGTMFTTEEITLCFIEVVFRSIQMIGTHAFSRKEPVTSWTVMYSLGALP